MSNIQCDAGFGVSSRPSRTLSFAPYDVCASANARITIAWADAAVTEPWFVLPGLRQFVTPFIDAPPQ